MDYPSVPYYIPAPESREHHSSELHKTADEYVGDLKLQPSITNISYSSSSSSSTLALSSSLSSTFSIPPSSSPSPSTTIATTTTTTTTNPRAISQATNLLLLLPGELRNTVYRLLLTSPRASLASLRRLLSARHCSAYVLPALPLHPALLSTCRQIHAEASPILYAENVFTANASLLTSMPHLVNPARPITAPGMAGRIKRWYVNVRIDCDARYTEDDVTRAFSGVEELEVEASQAMFRSAGVGVLMLFKGVRGVAKARVGGSVGEGFARWLEGQMESGADEVRGDREYDVGDERLVVGGLSEVFETWAHANR